MHFSSAASPVRVNQSLESVKSYILALDEAPQYRIVVRHLFNAACEGPCLLCILCHTISLLVCSFGRRCAAQVETFNLSNNWAVAHNGEERCCAHENQHVVERAGLLYEISNDDRRSDAG
jgi:hypothetical protein